MQILHTAHNFRAPTMITPDNVTQSASASASTSAPSSSSSSRSTSSSNSMAAAAAAAASLLSASPEQSDFAVDNRYQPFELADAPETGLGELHFGAKVAL